MNKKTPTIKAKRNARKYETKAIAIREISKAINRNITEKYIKPLLNDRNYR